jgi:hypothetical protein
MDPTNIWWMHTKHKYCFQRCAILVFIAQCLVLLLHLWFNMFLCVFVHQWTLMKIIGLLYVNHKFTWITKTIHNLHCVFLGHINPLKFGLGTTFFAITLFSFHHITLWKYMTFDYMSHITIIIMLYNKLDHTRGKASSSILQCDSHDRTWINMIQDHPKTTSFSPNHNHYHRLLQTSWKGTCIFPPNIRLG